ncbi:MAG TPA: hypothetical protein VG013_22180 [Gemmataceae bacterium]|jgi:hypothetical protein|nr:hypothetical protein [Gemmataceae bacterium]
MKHYRTLTLILGAALAAAAGTGLGAPGTPDAAKKEKKAADTRPGVHLTIYNSDYALVKDRRELGDDFRKGLNVIRFTDVAATLDATSVHFRSLTDPSATVAEQNYEFDLVNADKLLQKYIDKKITAHTKDGKSYEGTLLSFDDKQLVLAGDKDNGPIYMVERGDNIKRIQFSALPEGLLTRPTLVWEVEANKAGKHLVEVSYIANGIRWRSDYNVVLNPDDTKADVSGWVTIENKTGTAFNKAAVKLLAGDPNIDRTQMAWGSGPDYYKLVRTLPPTNKFGNDPSRAFGDYRMYNLPEKTTVGNNQIKQVELISANAVPVVKTYLYDGSQMTWYRNSHYIAPYSGEQNKKVNVLIEIQNRADERLGISLPAGKVRTYKKDTDGALEFIGEDEIKHTPRDERVVLHIGDAFDIVGEHKQTQFTKISDREYTEAFEIKLRNHKKEDVTVKVLEKMVRGGEWTVIQKDHDYEKIDSRTIIFPMKVPADKEVKVTYTVDYKW